jgi:anthranilate phosphoribosyltransferase
MHPITPLNATTTAMITSYLGRIAAGQDLTQDEMTAVMDQVMSGSVPEKEIAVLLVALKAKGESAEEIAGAAVAMRRHMTSVRTSRQGLVDTCGTGGIGSELFNISTAAAIVTAAAGVPVAKHGNRSVTSKSGSADVLAVLGVNVDASVQTLERCLDQLGICFCFAPCLHPAMKHVAPVRKKLGVPTIFNLLGPLCNPASAPFQLLGVGRPELHQTMAEVLARLGTEHAVVVHGTDGLGELSLAAPTDVIEVRGQSLRRFTWEPEDFGLETTSIDRLSIPEVDKRFLSDVKLQFQAETMKVSGPEQSAAIIRRVLDGDLGPERDIVVLNAAAALWTAGIDPSPRECAKHAARAIDRGSAQELLTAWAELSSRVHER